MPKSARAPGWPRASPTLPVCTRQCRQLTRSALSSCGPALLLRPEPLPRPPPSQLLANAERATAPSSVLHRPATDLAPCTCRSRAPTPICSRRHLPPLQPSCRSTIAACHCPPDPEHRRPPVLHRRRQPPPSPHSPLVIVQGPTIMANKEGNTPLHDALFHRHMDMALKLLEDDPRCAYALNAEMLSPLYIAGREGLVHVVKKIADQVLSTASVSIIGTVLHQAVLGDSIRALEILLNHIVELVESTDGTTQHNKARMISILLDKNSTPAKELLKQFPDAIEMVDNKGQNTFHIAIVNKKVSVLGLLLKYELPEEILNKQDVDGNTALHHAAKLHQGESVLWLLNDPRINSLVINKDGHTAWDYQIPIELMDQKLIDAIDREDIPSLINHLAWDPNRFYSVTPITRHTALHRAASKGNVCFVHHVLFYTNRNVGFIISKNIDGDTPLHLAVRAGHLEVVHHLICYVAWAREIEANLKLKEPLIMQNKKGNTLLHEAVIHDRYDLAVGLLDFGLEVTWAADTEFIKEYNEYANDVVSIHDVLLITRNGDWDTPLHIAAKVGNSRFVDMLIRCAKVMNRELKTKHAKGPIIMANKLGNTPLHNAVLHRKSDIALKLFEANPGCSHMLNAARQSPFYIAVRDGLTYVIKKVTDQGLDVASISNLGTVLHQAVLGGNIRALEILLNRYEKHVELTDLSGNNALHYASQLNNAHMVSILLNKNCTLAYKKNKENHTPLHMAARFGSAEAAKELLKRFPDAIEMVDDMGRNALHIAVINDKVNVLKLLLKYVLPEEMVNKQDVGGNTPLHHAASLYRIQPALLLLNDPRVNPSLFNEDGHTAFALSDRKGKLEMSDDEINLWKVLKKHESRSCKQQRVTTQQFRRKQQRVTTQQFRFKLLRQTGTNTGTTIVVATLMSIATFAATLTMPGGYNRQSGTAIVGHHKAFKIFVVCNTMSMCGWTVLVLCFIWWSQMDPVKAKLSMLISRDRLMLLSLLGMIMSMLTAVYLTVAPASRWVAYMTIAIGASTLFFGYLIRKK